MKEFRVQLTREYVITISAENKDAAREFTELYVSGGKDDSSATTQQKKKFKIENIKPTTNEAWMVEEIE